MTTRVERLRVGPLGENVYAVETGTTSFLVDPGDDAVAILDFLNDKKIRPGFIVLTHGHLDHCAAIPELLEAFKSAPPAIAIHNLDAPYLGARGEETNRTLFSAIGAPSFFHNYWKRLPEADLLLEDGQKLPGCDFEVLHTPGHSAGSICLYHRDSGSLLSGDTLFRDGVGRIDGPDSDYHALGESLRRLASLPLETIVYPGHGPHTTIGRELSHVLPSLGDRIPFER